MNSFGPLTYVDRRPTRLVAFLAAWGAAHLFILAVIGLSVLIGFSQALAVPILIATILVGVGTYLRLRAILAGPGRG